MRLLQPNTSKTSFAGLLCGLLLAHAAFAQSSLTTIQDTLFKADGTRFTGTIRIHWNTFDANNIGTVIQQSRAVQVTNGNLQVQLAPNAGAQAPANTYTVQYQSDGLEQFTETWSVPSSVAPLKVADVRTGTLGSTSTGSTTGTQTPITESSVIGLVADLAQRPVKGPGFGTGSVALVNDSGQIETVAGNVGDCVFADGTTGTCGAPAAQFFDAETPGGLVDGSNLTFTLANPPSGQSLQLFRNGLYMKAGSDYTLSGSTITFAGGAQPQPQDTLVASYRIDPVAGLANLTTSQPASSVMAQVLCSSNGRTSTGTDWSSLGSCDIPGGSLHPGDRYEVRFTFNHTGTTSGFAVQVNWGTVSILARQAGAQDGALVGQAEISITSSGGQVTLQSWGTVLGFLPGITSVPTQNGLKLDLRGKLLSGQTDSLSVSSVTVLRYPAH